MTSTDGTPAGWYHAPGDPDGTQRWWDGSQWVGEPQASAPPAPATSTPPPPPPSGGPPPPAPDPSGFGAPPPGYVAYGQGAGPATNLASPGQRMGARAIDWVIWVIVTAVFAVIFGFNALTGGDSEVSWAAGTAAGLVAGALIVAYEVLMVSSRGATLGKMALNLKVVREDGSPAELVDAVKRMSIYIASVVLGIIPFLGALASLATFGIGIVSLVFLFTDDRRQAVWDKIANTVVVTR